MTTSKKANGPGPARATQAAEPPPSGRRGTKTFPIVGIGASAGGLEAFTELLKHLPADTGMGYVLVQHLDPQHESTLTHLLARATTMRVCEVTQNLRVEPNVIYVIPPNAQMAIVGGVLKLTPRGTVRGATRSIDFFFEALAQDQRERAVGVVLSGTASDGTLGLEAIKAEGGMTLAQDETAKYDSMPRSAIAAGCVDFVLAPRAIAAELARIAKHPLIAIAGADAASAMHSEVEREADQHDDQDAPLASGGHGTPRTGSQQAKREAAVTADSPAAGGDAFKKVLLLLRNHCGVDFSLYKSNTIQRRVMRRLILNKHQTLAEYAIFLKGNGKELDALYSDVLISVTSFFRNPEAFDTLKQKVFPQLLAQRNRDEPVRVWVLGCSTGQEAYSLAMTFAEAATDEPHAAKLQIFATDLNEALLDKARHGLYSMSLAQDVSPERLRRFFVEEQGGYRVIRSLREQVVFARQNVMSDPPFSRMDLIACRNLLIYLEPDLQKKIFPAFHYALKPGGFLFLGASESIGQFTELFAPADKKQKIFCKKAAPTPAFRLPLPSARESQPSPGQRASALTRAPLLPDAVQGEFNAQREADRISVSQFAPPGVLINAEGQVLQFRGATGAYLTPPTGKASFDVLKMAREGLMLPLRAAINKAKRDKKPVRREGLRVGHDGDARATTLQIIPLRNINEQCFLILFEDADATSNQRAVVTASPPVAAKREVASRIAELERELTETREYLQSIQEQNEAANEELQASSEEVQSANEELQSINEELETSKEELESSNEELTTINDEIVSRNSELNRSNADLNNVLVGMQTAILILSRDLTIRRFTPAAEKIFNLLAGDVGRGFGGIRHNLDVSDLERLLAEVIDTVSLREREVQDKNGRWYMLRARPYVTLDNKIDGIVLVLNDIDALKRTESQAEVARDYAQAILRAAPVPFLVLRADLRVDTASDSFYKNFEVVRAATEGRLVYEIGSGQWNIPKLRELLEEIIPRDNFFDGFEVTHEFPGIGARTMLLNARRIESAASVPELILLAVDDITDRQHAAHAVRRSEANLRDFVENATVGLHWVGPDGIILWANQTELNLLGYTRDEYVGRHIAEFHVDAAVINDILTRLIGGEALHDFAARLRCKDGSIRDVLINSNVLFENGKFVHTRCFTRDITEQKKNALALLESEQRMRLATEATSVGIWEWNVSTGVILWDAQMFRIYGMPRTADGAVEYGEWIASVVPEDLAGQAEDAIQNTLRGLGNNSLEFRILRRADGQCRRIRAVATVRKNADGEAEWLVGTNLDVTDRKQMEEALQDADRRKDEFLATLAHELRNPLAPIRSGVQLLRRLDHQSETAEQVRRMMERQLDQMVRLVDDLMDVSRISRGKLELRRERMPLAVVIDSALETSRPLIEAAGQKLTVNLPTESVAVEADLVRLAQVFMNLLNNAAKYGERGGCVDLTVEREESEVRVSVRDSGVGIAAEHLPHIFEMFTQLERSIDRSQGGLGIGLSLVQRLVEMHGGSVAAHSDGPGKGSEFVVRLPVAIEPSTPQTASRPDGTGAQTSSLRILIVDDNRDSADSLSMLLQLAGNITRTAYDGQEGVDAAAQFQPDVVLLDIGLPKLNGYEACQRIRDATNGKDIILIAVTGWGQPEDRRRSHDAGFDHHIVKPVDPDVLMKLLSESVSAAAVGTGA